MVPDTSQHFQYLDAKLGLRRAQVFLAAHLLDHLTEEDIVGCTGKLPVVRPVNHPSGVNDSVFPGRRETSKVEPPLKDG